jgi:hypothetical protein
MLPSRWLYADLDDVDPFTIEDKYMPTSAWQSSLHRYQCLWLTPHPLDPNLHQRINRQLSTVLKADPGGWDATQVLRLPGTKNYKYDPPSPVTVLWESENLIFKAPRPPVPIEGSTTHLLFASNFEILDLTARQLFRLHRDKIPAGVKQKLQAREATGDRSRVLWRLESTLLQRGIPAGDVYVLLKGTVWNKFTDQRLIQDIIRCETYMAARMDSEFTNSYYG